jgi:hypothetical protein
VLGDRGQRSATEEVDGLRNTLRVCDSVTDRKTALGACGFDLLAAETIDVFGRAALRGR